MLWQNRIDQNAAAEVALLWLFVSKAILVVVGMSMVRRLKAWNFTNKLLLNIGRPMRLDPSFC